MGLLRRRASAIAAVTTLVCAGGAGVVVAGSESGDEASLQPARGPANGGVEQRVERLLRQMTLDEKLQQLTLLSDGQITDADAQKGVGGVFSLVDPEKINHFQKVAMEQSRLKIPILFAYDTIHGYRTVFPIPLGAAASFDPRVAADDHRIGAMESAAVGIKQIYSPMVDVSHDPRWGRISEGNGEDPYLASVMAAARVKAAQGGDYSKPGKVVTSVKHYAAYGEPEGGRDYNTTDLSEQRLRNLYLPPFKAAIDAGSDTAMCSFNAINGSPGCADKHILTDILRGEWRFDGFVESDYTAVAELRACPPKNPDSGPCGHGVAADGPDAARLALNAGTDTEMVSTNYRDFGRQLVQNRQVSMKTVDEAVRRVLRIKFRAGLFENPYVDPAKADEAMLKPESRAAARNGAARSMVLLKNADGVLPFDPAKKTAVIGPLGDNQHDMLGPWWGRGEDKDVISPLTGLREASTGAVTYAEGCKMVDNDLYDPANECPSDAGFGEAVAAAQAADQVVLAVGEVRGQSGEAEVRSDLTLPGVQEKLVDAIVATGKPVAVVVFSGRPLDLSDVDGSAKSILQAWFPGVEAGNALADVVFGKVNPGGKLPASFPRSVGQVPIYYNHEPTGRPCDVGSKYNSRYRDITSCDPLYEFGHGLSYTTFAMSNLRLSSNSLSRGGSVRVSVDVKNTGSRRGDEVAQLYLRDPVASLSQPVRRLRGFERVTLDPGQSTTVTWRLDASDVGFYDNSGTFVVEPGAIDVFAGNTSSAKDLTATFTVR